MEKNIIKYFISIFIFENFRKRRNGAAVFPLFPREKKYEFY